MRDEAGIRLMELVVCDDACDMVKDESGVHQQSIVCLSFHTD